MSDAYVSPYLMQSGRVARPNQEFHATPEEVVSDDGLSLAEKSLYLDRMEQETVAALTMDDKAEATVHTRLLEAIKLARRSLSRSS